jgi:hypothetical protein
MHLTAHVLGASFAQKSLPVVAGIDLTVTSDMPKDRDPEQAWFWTPEWQAKEREADEDIAAGRVEHFDSDEAFLASFGD